MWLINQLLSSPVGKKKKEKIFFFLQRPSWLEHTAEESPARRLENFRVPRGLSSNHSVPSKFTSRNYRFARNSLRAGFRYMRVSHVTCYTVRIFRFCYSSFHAHEHLIPLDVLKHNFAPRRFSEWISLIHHMHICSQLEAEKRVQSTHKMYVLASRCLVYSWHSSRTFESKLTWVDELDGAFLLWTAIFAQNDKSMLIPPWSILPAKQRRCVALQ